MNIGILTSGGDAPGMNACIRALVRSAIFEGMRVFGIHRGYSGLINDDIEEMNNRSVSDIIQRGGTILRTARCPEFMTKEGMAKAYESLKKYGITALVTIGGDGTFRGGNDFSSIYKDISVIGIPGTIDNDLPYTDFTLGFDTAVNTVIGLVNNLRDTMTSHEMISIVQVMGRNCGDIALYSGLVSGAEIIIIPEIPVEVSEIVDSLNYSVNRGKKSNIVIVAEGVKNYPEILKALTDSGLSIRTTVLGHIQRGGSPSMVDRLLAAQFSYKAINLLKEGKKNRVIGIVNNKIIDEDIVAIQSMKRQVNKEIYELAKILGR